MPAIYHVYINIYIYIVCDYVCVLYSISYIGLFVIILYNSHYILRIYQEYDMANTGGLASNLWSLSSSLFSDLNGWMLLYVDPKKQIALESCTVVTAVYSIHAATRSSSIIQLPFS